MNDNNDDSKGKEYSCWKMSYEDLDNYALLKANFETGHSIRQELKELSRFGKGVRGIYESIENHLEECKKCKDYFIEMAAIQKFAAITIDSYSSDHTQKRLEEARKEFATNHLTYDDPEGLEDYIIERASADASSKDHEINEKFEKHIKNSRSSKEYYKSLIHIAIRNSREKKDE